MKLLDFLKKKKGGKKKEEKKIRKVPSKGRGARISSSAAGGEKFGKKSEEKTEKESPLKTEVKKSQLVSTGKYGGIILSPHIAEKSSFMGKNRQYVFKVSPAANKFLVKKAIEDIYNVAVADIQILNMPAKQKRLGRTMGVKSGFKKAVVKLIEGDSIEVMPQ